MSSWNSHRMMVQQQSSQKAPPRPPPAPRHWHTHEECRSANLISRHKKTPQDMNPYSETHTAMASYPMGAWVGGRPGGWTQDLHVTSPMSPPAPSDPTTLAFASSFPPQPRQQTTPTCAVPVPTLPVPQQPRAITATRAVVPVWPPPPLLAPTPQLANTGGLPSTSRGSIPRPAPREHCLQDDLYYTFTRDAYLCSATAAAREVAATLTLNQGYHCAGPASALAVVPTATTATAIAVPKETVNKTHRRPQHPLKRRLHALPPQNHSPAKRLRLPTNTTTTTTTANNNNNNDLHFVDSSLFATLNAAMMEIASRQLPTHQPMSTSSPKISFKDTTWTFPKKLKKKRPRPSDIFNINFGFGFSSRRRQSSDYSPQVSPRTSISSASGSPRTEMTECFKRQRIDSSGSDADVTRSKSARLSIITPTTSHTQCSEPHPGQLVDFTQTPPSLPPSPPPVPAPAMQLPPSPKQSPKLLPKSNPTNEPSLRLTTDAYHEYLATTQRRKSFPAGEWATRRIREEFQILTKLDAGLTREEEIESIDPLDTTTTTVTAANDISLIAPFDTPATTTQPIENSNCELRRTTSDPSTERFLLHIRASLEARRTKSGNKTWQSYPVFADEVEKGFLDDAPL
ncbi:hypothetical protein COCMIDRAFT_1515 [Bipolaris oryzae ATCC 44560]|uniref:Uncharacterized protein n=1 Tax=Bipolaris oryzae ATCC 44560 TaxID=930090 RepID=W6ZI73_COCMI|nr:uncharacterized protein COCMIDRAFT_1515 [Bipolaris oryzae ATCC 44560]EUC49675.1 hypothetical protein COCMIDRAFT_1515 [Bipolaris oryzae ATCC 44560]